MRCLPLCLPAIRGMEISLPEMKNPAGFTLMEVVIAMVLIGIMAAMMSTGVVHIIQGYGVTRDNADTALKGQVALTRITKELRALESVTSGSRTSMTYAYHLKDALVTQRTLAWDGTAGSSLTLGGAPLVDGVQDFILSYHNGFDDAGDNTWNGGETLINVTIRISGASDVNTDFSARVAPRNLN